jgi:hypothetical protein
MLMTSEFNDDSLSCGRPEWYWSSYVFPTDSQLTPLNVNRADRLIGKILPKRVRNLLVYYYKYYYYYY